MMNRFENGFNLPQALKRIQLRQEKKMQKRNEKIITNIDIKHANGFMLIFKKNHFLKSLSRRGVSIFSLFISNSYQARNGLNFVIFKQNKNKNQSILIFFYKRESNCFFYPSIIFLSAILF